MQFLTIAAVSFATLAMAAPAVQGSETGPEKRADTGVYVCNNNNIQPYCVHIPAPSGVCVPFGQDINDQASSIGPDAGSFCTFFVDDHCSDAHGWFQSRSPGVPDLRFTTVWNNGVQSIIDMNDKISSYRCQNE